VEEEEEEAGETFAEQGRRPRDPLHVTAVRSHSFGGQEAGAATAAHVAEEEEEGDEAKPAKMCSSKGCAAIIDSGSNIIAGPREEISRITRRLKVKTDCSNLKQLPHLSFKLGGHDVNLPAAAYVMKVKLPTWARHPSGRASLSEGSTATPWEHVLETLRDRGLDLGPSISGGLGGMHMKELAGLKELCMAAFVTLDMNTANGPLWVIGTPLFDRYYTRWSWKEGAASPQIFIKELRTAKTCKSNSSALAAVVGRGQGGSPRLVRSENRHEEPTFEAEDEAPLAEEPPLRDADELRYPHWAKSLTQI
jgi:hypothetical protein